MDRVNIWNFFGSEALTFDKIFRDEQGKSPFHNILQR